MMRTRRRVDVAATIAQAAAHAETYDNPPPRRAINGHTANCPNRLDGPMRRCGWCRAEALERGQRVVNGTVVPATSVLAGGRPRRACVAVPPPALEPARPRQAELRSCLGCCSPTDHPSRHCPSCRPTESP
jgi:hypothetical protein